MSRDPKSTAHPPLYLLRTTDSCPGCGKPTPVYALLASSFYDGYERGTYDNAILEYIERLPKPFLRRLQERCPTWGFDREDSSVTRYAMNPGATYLINHCQHCEVPLPDFYLFGEPGSPFFPTDEDECENIGVYLLPEEEDISLVAASIVDAGGLTDWLNYDNAKPWEELPAPAAPLHPAARAKPAV
jgi:hypothetical protein